MGSTTTARRPAGTIQPLRVDDHTIELTYVPETARPPEPWQPSQGGKVARIVVLCCIVLVVLAIPALLPSVLSNVAVRALVYAIVGLSMNVLVGYTGQISLGHAAFVGVGAFTAGYGISEMGLPWVGALGLAMIVGAVAAILLGIVALRLSGLYLALVTIAYGLFTVEVIFGLRPLTGGGAGMEAPRPEWFSGDLSYIYLCMGILALILLFDWRLTASKAGRAIRALRDDERVAASWGINVTAYKLLAFAISGVLAAVGGTLFASIEGVVVAPDFEFTLSLTFLVMTVIGGAGNRWGVVQASIFVAALPTLLDIMALNFQGVPVLGQINASASPLVTAVLLLLVLTVAPGGIAQLEAPVLRWLSFKRFRQLPDTAVMAADIGGSDAR